MFAKTQDRFTVSLIGTRRVQIRVTMPGALGADQQTDQVVAWVSSELPPTRTTSPWQHHFETQGVVGGHAYAACRSARVLADVAADGARLLAGRIGTYVNPCAALLAPAAC